MDDELPQFPNPMDDPRIVELQDRINRALAGIGALNSVKAADAPNYAVDETFKLVARIEALASVLVSHGIIDYVEYTGEHLIREAESLERALLAFTEDKRRRTGLVLPPQNGAV